MMVCVGVFLFGSVNAAPAKAEDKRYEEDLGQMKTPWGMFHAYRALKPWKRVELDLHAAPKKKMEGELVVIALIAKDGDVAEAKIERSSGTPFLDEAALAAVKLWRYRVPVEGERCVTVQQIVITLK